MHGRCNTLKKNLKSLMFPYCIPISFIDEFSIVLNLISGMSAFITLVFLDDCNILILVPN